VRKRGDLSFSTGGQALANERRIAESRMRDAAAETDHVSEDRGARDTQAPLVQKIRRARARPRTIPFVTGLTRFPATGRPYFTTANGNREKRACPWRQLGVAVQRIDTPQLCEASVAFDRPALFHD